MERPNIPGHSKKDNSHESVVNEMPFYLETEAMKETTYFCLCNMGKLLTKISNGSLKFLAIGYVIICNFCKLSSGPVTMRPNAK